MPNNPLAPPDNLELVYLFQSHFRLRQNSTPFEHLRKVASAFARIPYENLTKIIKEVENPGPGQSRRGPSEVLSQHVALRTGGTCFSLTATLLHIIRALGWRAEPILADRSYGENTHSALIVWIGGIPHLLDPGFLIVDPIPLDAIGVRQVDTAFNRLILTTRPGTDRIDLCTVQEGKRKYRLTFKTQPADTAEFLGVWDSSFDWEMMRYPLLTRATEGRQIYLRGNQFQIRSHESIERCRIPSGGLHACIWEEFGVHPDVVVRALEILKQRGELRGKA